jgi:hypothetical protein
MSQEETFTSEQLSAEANRHGGLVADMLNYAATLRQQAAQPDDSRCPSTYRREEAVKVLIGMGWSWDGKQWNAPVQQAARVDEAMVFRAMRAWGEAPPHGDINRMRAALEAALSAQPAERQGECVGEVFGPKAVSTMVALDRPLPPGTKLYTHPAAPVGVPDGWRDAIQEAISCLDDVERYKGNLAIVVYRRIVQKLRDLLAAAPSAPQALRTPSFAELQTWALCNGMSGASDQEALDAWRAVAPPVPTLEQFKRMGWGEAEKNEADKTASAPQGEG